MSAILRTEHKLWSRAKKTSQLRAKPIASIIQDPLILGVFKLETLEATEVLAAEAVLCIGPTGDVWQQSGKALLKKYTVISIDPAGYLVCEPKPENEVQFFELTKDLVGMDSGDDSYVLIQGLYGETILGIPNLQKAKVGDFICRQVHDHNDQWVVQRKIFLNTYTVLSDQEIIDNQPWL